MWVSRPYVLSSLPNAAQRVAWPSDGTDIVSPRHVPSPSHWNKQLWDDLESPKTFKKSKNSASPGP